MRPSREIPGEQQIFRPVTEEKGSRSSDLQLEQLIISMALNDIKEMKETVDADCERFEKEVYEIWIHLHNAKAESGALEREMGSSFKRLKKMFFEDRPKKPRDFLPSVDCLQSVELDQEVITAWEAQATKVEETERKREIPIIVDLIKMIRQELEDLGKKTKKKTDEMLSLITQLKNDAHLQHLSLKSANEGLDKKFLELEELIQRCCTIKKLPLSILEGSRD